MPPAGGKGANLASMFDPEVIEILREQFQEADADGSGEIDAEEACTLFAKLCAAGSSQAEVAKMASSLRNQMDSDRNGKISFEEYAFRFGRKLQMEVARRRREGLPLRPTPAAAPAPTPPPAQDPVASSGLQQRRAAREEVQRTAAAPPPPNQGDVGTERSDSRAFLVPLGIGLVMLVIFLVAVFLPAPDAGSKRIGGNSGSYKAGSAKGKSRGR